MRAHFASDVPVAPDTNNDFQQSSNYTKEPQPQVAGSSVEGNPLQARIFEFKSDSSNMAVVGEFIDDVLQKAEDEANKQQNDKKKNSQQGKNKTQKQNFKNGKVVNRARGFVVKLFESICNCANNAAAVPVTRFKFRSGKRTPSNANATDNNGKAECNNKKEEKHKKSSNGGKKNDNVKIEVADELQETIELQ